MIYLILFLERIATNTLRKTTPIPARYDMLVPVLGNSSLDLANFSSLVVGKVALVLFI